MQNENSLLQDSTVYAFHIPTMNAIKVGFGANSHARMESYSRKYALLPDQSSLKTWRLPTPSIASSIESACHAALLQAGFHRVDHDANGQTAQELFNLGPFTYNDATLLVAQAIEEVINSLHEALGKYQPLAIEKARQKMEFNEQKRKELKEKRLKHEEKKENRLIQTAVPELQERWDSEMVPFINLCKETRKYWKEFDNRQGLISSIFQGKQTCATRMRKFQYWPQIKKLIPPLFHAGRMAKTLYCEMGVKHGRYAEKAAKKLNLSLYCPSGNHLPLVNGAKDENGQAYLEVRLVVQQATGFSGWDAEELMKNDKVLQALIAYAEREPSVELSYSYKDFY